MSIPDTFFDVNYKAPSEAQCCSDFHFMLLLFNPHPHGLQCNHMRCIKLKFWRFFKLTPSQGHINAV